MQKELVSKTSKNVKKKKMNKKVSWWFDPVRWVIFCGQRFLSCMAFSVYKVVRVRLRD